MIVLNYIFLFIYIYVYVCIKIYKFFFIGIIFFIFAQISLQNMLNNLGLRFEGQPHSGIDDSRNIARVVIMLLRDGATLRVNEMLKETPDSK